ncbi:hypothetical protein F4677DRAFT_447207 [Hypoxylon crocopeplum]|nr:hypothetical protein F4677DRAFT_447207 [Hypoxylon crocopeplum]
MPRQRVPITFTYQKCGTNPPIYVAGSFSDPPWQPQEMDVSIDQHGGHRFTKQVMVDDGSEVQYKFRIGAGDWWALDDNADTVTDNQGNINNVLRVSISGPRENKIGVPNPRVNELKGSATSSGIQTPDFAKTAAEVANSASFLDPETPEPEISDGEAGRKGIRRLSNTPISEVAQTAIEVATVAATLDVDDSSSDDDDDEEDEDDLCPVFSYEFTGPPCHEENQLGNKTTVEDGDPACDIEDLDFDDPRLEAFPSNNRDSILATMRRISTSIDADRTVIEEISPSPLITISRNYKKVGSLDKPSTSRGSIEITSRDEPTLRPGGIGKRPSSINSGKRAASTSSLISINEDDEVLNDKTANEPADGPAFIQHPGPSWGSPFEHAVSEDENDEGIAMNKESKYTVAESQVCPPSTSELPTPSSSVLEVSQPGSAPVSEEPSAGSHDHSVAAENDAGKDSPSITARHTPGTYESDSSHEETLGEGEVQSTSIGSGNQSGLRKRTADRPSTSPSTNYFQDPNRHPDWLETCFKVVVVKWLGGVALWLYGRRHRAFIAAGTAAVFVGIGMLWPNPMRI